MKHLEHMVIPRARQLVWSEFIDKLQRGSAKTAVLEQVGMVVFENTNRPVEDLFRDQIEEYME